MTEREDEIRERQMVEQTTAAKAEVTTLREVVQRVRGLLGAWAYSEASNEWLAEPADDWDRGYAACRRNDVQSLHERLTAALEETP